MKGMLNFLEKAGLVTREESAIVPAPVFTPVSPPDAAPVQITPMSNAAKALPDQMPAHALNPANASLDLEAVYARANVPTAIYPAERLLRLMDGLAAMDPAVRLMAIQAMDAADESWTLADPLNDAAAKLQALAAHGAQLQADLQGIERDTQALLDQATVRHDQRLGDIRRQMAELQALAEREQARAAQETAQHQTRLQSAREQTAQALDALAQASTRLQSLASQLGAAGNPVKE